MRIAENVVLGLDLGTSSIGWALIEENPETQERRILSRQSSDGVCTYALGSRIIDAPEEAKEHKLYSVTRREKRAVRRVIARKAQRMRAIRHLLMEAGLPEVKDLEYMHHQKGHAQTSPWELRRRGLREKLSDREFAIVLLHIAGHRGFRSNSKSESADAEAGKVKKALAALETTLRESGAETIGQLLAGQSVKRNRTDYKGDAHYEHMLMRTWQEEEVRLLFERQRALGNALAASGIEARYASLAFDQRELKSVAAMIGNCVFLEGEKRAPAFSPTAEYFRFLQRIVQLRLRQHGGLRPLSPEERETVRALFGKTAKITYKNVRKALNLGEDVFFDDLSYPLEQGATDMSAEKTDVVRRSGEACAGTKALKDCLDPVVFTRLWEERTGEEDSFPGWPVVDRIAKILSDNDGFSGMERELAGLSLAESVRQRLLEAARAGKFRHFRGTMRLSIKAMRAIMPHLYAGLRYDEACEAAGFDHARERDVDINDIRNPVVQHLLREMRRQARAICHEFGLWPGRVHIELLRDVGKSARERAEMEKGQNRRAKERAAHAADLRRYWGREPSAMELKRYELWLEQGEMCAYARLLGTDAPVYRGAPGGHIPLDWLKDGENRVQIDHILPRSRTFDNSMANQCLCLAGANQAKLNRTPFEWRGGNEQVWNEYAVWVQSLHIRPRKKRAFLLRDLSAEMEGNFHARNLTDSAYVARLAAQWFRKEYEHLLRNAPEEVRQRRRVFTRPGAVTSFLRRVWGVQSLKKNDKGEREGDQHHALDAVIVACCTEGMLQAITKAFQKNETEQLHDRLPWPWEHFRSSLEPLVNAVSVSREVKSRKTGALHEETLRAVRTEAAENGEMRQVVYERCWVGNLKPGDVDRIKDPERCKPLVAALRHWLQLPEKDRPPFRDPLTGNIVRHVRLRRGEFTSGVLLRRGGGMAQADNGGMARVDVYTRNGRFFLVPVYMKDIADGRLPVRACKNGTPEAQWPVMDESFAFCFSLTGNCYVLTMKNGTVREGYYRTTDRATVSISLAEASDKTKLIRGIGVQTLQRFEKYLVDRLGRRIRVQRERDPRQA